MNERDNHIFRYFLKAYKHQWDANAYARDNYNIDLEYYRGYRNAADYPLAYNVSFNRILPIIHTLLSRFMDQLYQSSNLISVKPRKSADINKARAVEGVLNFQLENLNSIDCQGGSYLTMMKWFFNTLTFGKGIAKAYWRKEERIMPKRMALPKPNFDRQGNFQGWDTIDHISQEMQIAYDGPYVEILHNKLFVPDPQYRNIQQMPCVFLVYKKSMDDVKRKADKGEYKNINKLGAEIGSGGASGEPEDSREAFIKSLNIEGALTADQLKDDRRSPEVDILECYGKVILKSEPYTVGSGIMIKGKEEEVICHIGNYNTILSLQKNTYGIRQLFDMGCYYHPELYWDLGLVTLTRDIQEQINNLANLRMQNAMMSINQMLKVNVNSDIDPEALIWKPFGIIPVEDMGDVDVFPVPDMNSNMFIEQETFYKNAVQDITGMYDYNMGQTPQRQERVGVVYGIQAMGEARAKLMLMSMDYLGIRPLLNYMMVLNTFHLPSGFEYRIGEGDQTQFGQIFGNDIHPNFDFAARYTAMEPALGKQARSQQLVQMASLWAQNPWINQYQFHKTLMELLDIREAEYLLKKPEDFQKEMIQQQEAQMKAAAAEGQGDIEARLAKSEKDTEGKIKVEDKKFQHNMMLEAIKQEAINQ